MQFFVYYNDHGKLVYDYDDKQIFKNIYNYQYHQN